jgi:phosphoglycolate phosphatase
MAANFTSILFDLDGTIIDSAPGITATLAYTFETMGRPVPSPAELLAYVGPPILESFRDRAGMTLGEAAEALAIYRPRYLESGALNSAVFPGVPEVLSVVHAAGIPLSLATSKPETPATLMLSHFGLLHYFDVITGDREHDIEGAAANSVPTIFADWGYGAAAEQVGSTAVAHTPAELRRLLLG